MSDTDNIDGAGGRHGLTTTTATAVLGVDWCKKSGPRQHSDDGGGCGRVPSALPIPGHGGLEMVGRRRSAHKRRVL
jgi:hypothetical protein